MVVGDKKKNTLLAIKRVTLQRKTRAKLEFAAPDEVCASRIISSEMTVFVRNTFFSKCSCVFLFLEMMDYL